MTGGTKSSATKASARGLCWKSRSGKPAGGQRYFSSSSPFSCAAALRAKTPAPPAASPSLNASLLLIAFLSRLQS
jgi:hypothetical protein